MTIVLIIASIVFLLLAVLYLNQDRLIYYPRQYDTSLDTKASGVVPLSYDISRYRQMAFFLPPRRSNPGSPAPLWIFFGGNATLALDWLDFCSQYPDESAAFLLVDYPGYGLNKGRPTPHSIREAANAAYEALLEHPDVDGTMLSDPAVLGHSLGAAAALQFTRSHNVRASILLAPFTSMLDMAKHQVGCPLCYLLAHRYDNRAALESYCMDSGSVFIMHGSEDEIIPVFMGRELSQICPGSTRYIEVQGGSHASILHENRPEIFAAMSRVDSREL